MDDRTAIAKDVLCAIVGKLPVKEIDENLVRDETDARAIGAVMHADSLLAELSRTAKPQPAPQPASKGVRWRKMDDPPSHGGCVLVSVNRRSGIDAAYRDVDCWRMWSDGSAWEVEPGEQWLDLGDLRPTEGDE